MLWINHNSALVLGIGILNGAAFFLMRDGIKPRDLLVLAGMAVLLAAVWLWSRPRQTDLEQVSALQANIGSGVPVLLEIQSPY